MTQVEMVKTCYTCSSDFSHVCVCVYLYVYARVHMYMLQHTVKVRRSIFSPSTVCILGIEFRSPRLMSGSLHLQSLLTSCPMISS